MHCILTNTQPGILTSTLFSCLSTIWLCFKLLAGTIQFKSTLDSKHLTCTSNPTLSIASGYGSDTDGTHGIIILYVINGNYFVHFVSDMNHFSKIAILHSDGLSDQHDSTSRGT